MDGEVVLAAAATLIALAFALSTLERWLARRRRHELAWTLSLFLFAAASGALWLGGAIGWNEAIFKVFFVLGAIMNVPVLAVGTVYLLTNQRTGDVTFAAVSLVAVFCAGWVFAAPLTDVMPAGELPQGEDVFGPVPRAMAAVASGLGALVLLAGALWSIGSLLHSKRSTGTASPGRSTISPGRLAGANALIATGTVVLSAGGLANAALGEMGAFALSLVVGISFIFAGFLVTNPGPPSTPQPDDLPDWLHDALTEPAETRQIA